MGKTLTSSSAVPRALQSVIELAANVTLRCTFNLVNLINALTACLLNCNQVLNSLFNFEMRNYFVNRWKLKCFFMKITSLI